MSDRVTRRQFLAGTGAATGAVLLGPIVGRVGPAFGQTSPDPSSATRNRLVVIFLEGGNDGLNYVVPRDDVAGAPRYSVYRKVRPTLAYRPNEVLPLDLPGDAPQQLGFNRKLTTLHRFYREGRVAVVQGVDYPKHNYSHFTSTDIWHSGEPERAGSSGWIGRHVDRVGVGEGEMRAVAISTKIPLMLVGQKQPAAAMTSIGAMRFSDGAAGLADARHDALASFGAARAGDPLRHAVGRVGAQAVGLVDVLSEAKPPPSTGIAIGDALLTARVLLEQNLGVETVYVNHPGFDTHASQMVFHERLLQELDTALELFWLGTNGGAAVGQIGALRPDLAARTLIMIVSEFGRRIGEAGGGAVSGTDHGAAAPVVLVGPPATSGSVALVGGLHGDHPVMGTTAAPAENLELTTDLRSVYSAVLGSWFADTDPLYRRFSPLPGLFRSQAPGAAGSVGAVAGSGRAPAQAAGSSAIDGETAGVAALGDRAGSAPRGRMRLHEAAGGDGFHPVGGAAAAALHAVVLLLLVRSGQLRNIGHRLKALFTNDAAG